MWLLCSVAQLFGDGKQGGADGRLGVLDYFPFPLRLVMILMTFFIYFLAMPPLLLLPEWRDDLQCALAEVPSREMCVIMGDFNARVGSRTGMDDLWQDVRGPHGFGNVNEARAGTSLLSFLSINDAVICNTWFEKGAIHMATWQHPRSKQWHCIDFMIMHKSQLLSCLDVSVM